MNFDPKTKAWLMLILKMLGTGGTIGYGSFLTGSHWIGATIIGFSSACIQIQSQLADAPKDVAEKARTAAPFPAPTVPKL